MSRLFKQLLDTEPMVVVGLGLGVSGLGFVYFGPRIRGALGLPTTQYHGMQLPYVWG